MNTFAIQSATSHYLNNFQGRREISIFWEQEKQQIKMAYDGNNLSKKWENAMSIWKGIISASHLSFTFSFLMRKN